jgi:hypothetical protein
MLHHQEAGVPGHRRTHRAQDRHAVRRRPSRAARWRSRRSSPTAGNRLEEVARLPRARCRPVPSAAKATSSASAATAGWSANDPPQGGIVWRSPAASHPRGHRRRRRWWRPAGGRWPRAGPATCAGARRAIDAWKKKKKKKRTGRFAWAAVSPGEALAAHRVGIPSRSQLNTQTTHHHHKHKTTNNNLQSPHKTRTNDTYAQPARRHPTPFTVHGPPRVHPPCREVAAAVACIRSRSRSGAEWALAQGWRPGRWIAEAR